MASTSTTIPAFALPSRPLIPTEQQRNIIANWLYEAGPYLSSQEELILRNIQDKSYNSHLLVRLANRPPILAHLGTTAWYEQQVKPLKELAGEIIGGLKSFTAASRKQTSTVVPPYFDEGSGSTGSSGIISPALPSGTVTPRSKSNANLALERDNRVCCITALPLDDGWPLEVAHVISYGLANSPQQRHSLKFWKMLDLFMGESRTDALWEYLRGPDGKNINRLENLITLDARMHRLFDRGFLILMPLSSVQTHTDVMVRWLGPNNMRHPTHNGMLRTLRSMQLDVDGILPGAQDLQPNDALRLKSRTDSPLPSRFLLGIHAALHELRHLSAMGEVNDLDSDNRRPIPTYMCDDSDCESEDEGIDILDDTVAHQSQLDAVILQEKLNALIASQECVNLC